MNGRFVSFYFLLFFFLSCKAKAGSHGSSTVNENANDSSIVLYFNLAKKTTSSFSYVSLYGDFKQLYFGNLAKDSIYPFLVQREKPLQVYYNFNGRVIPFCFNPGDTATILIRNGSIEVTSKRKSKFENEAFILLNKSGYSIFDYQFSFFNKAPQERNVLLQKQYDSSLSFLRYHKDSLSKEAYDQYLNMVKYEYLSHKLTRMAVDKDPRLAYFADSLLPLTTLQEYYYLKEQKLFLDTYSRVRWGVDYKSPDYLAKMYDSSSVFYTGKIRDQRLFGIIRDMRPEYFKKYIERFYSDCKDAALIRYIDHNYAKKEINDKNELITVDNKRTNLMSLINANKNKVVYIDFWASWCLPCRKEMPAAKALQESYKNKPFVYVYVSIDEISTNWEEANKEDKLDVGNNYRLSDSQNSEISKFFDISSIPRYVLINKKGDIISRNAPRPGEQKLKELIDQSLGQ